MAKPDSPYHVGSEMGGLAKLQKHNPLFFGEVWVWVSQLEAISKRPKAERGNRQVAHIQHHLWSTIQFILYIVPGIGPTYPYKASGCSRSPLRPSIPTDTSIQTELVEQGTEANSRLLNRFNQLNNLCSCKSHPYLFRHLPWEEEIRDGG